jgi:hypothetical protein
VQPRLLLDLPQEILKMGLFLFMESNNGLLPRYY